MSGRTVSVLTVFLTLTLASADYWKARDAFVKQEEAQMVGASIVLTKKEQKANQILMGYKLREYDAGFRDPGVFAPGKHFFRARKDIEASKVFKFIQKVPKGAALHGHDISLASAKFVFNLTYSDNLYACIVDGRLKLLFMESPGQDQSCNWNLISTLRKQDPSYDAWVRSQLTLDVEDPKSRYPDIDVIWKTFMSLFTTVYPMVTYRPIFQRYFYQALEELREDNVMYLEFRGTLPQVYELDGTKHDQIETAGFYQDVIERFKRDHPDFFGGRFIYAPVRRGDNATADNYVQIVTTLKERYPQLLAGFDLVGQEDLGRPLVDFARQLEEISSRGIDFFFHSGETNWYGTSTDFNLVDAVLLGSKRIGHGYALNKHPLVLETVKQKGIAIEICPISNQVLMLVDDMRNHPAASLLAEGYPVVVSYDDPSFWSTKGLSYDFYMVFMGMASRNADLRMLKQLARNSLLYSAMPDAEKEMALKMWEEHWNAFIDEMVEG